MRRLRSRATTRLQRWLVDACLYGVPAVALVAVAIVGDLQGWLKFPIAVTVGVLGGWFGLLAVLPPAETAVEAGQPLDPRSKRAGR